MECGKGSERALLSLIFLSLIQEICMQECGWAHRIERFMEEQEAMEGSWPWMVAIARRSSDEGKFVHLCSGAMITRKHVLTVASCFQSRDVKSEHIARIGHVDERLAQEYNVSQIVLHKDYNGKYYANIAVMTLSREVFSEDFNPICLPTKNEFKNLTGEFTTVVGWGTTSIIHGDNRTYPILRERFGLLVITNSRCDELSRRDYNYYFWGNFKNGITEEMMCTEFPYQCIGERGSPLMFEKEDQWYVVGLVSFTFYCEFSFTSTGYVRVTEYLDWIQSNTKVCGLANKYNTSNEDGDVPYSQNPWPWMVAITLRRKDKLVHLCSGSMITSRHVLTSSRCFDSTDPSMYAAKIGGVDERTASRYEISGIIVPPTYVRDQLDDDIAILTLTRDVALKGFNPICLPPNREFVVSAGESTAAVGWGIASGNGPDYPILRQKFNLKVITNSKCNEVFSAVKYSENSRGISNKMICTAYPSKCIGDLGSPLMYEKDGQWYVIGLMSFRFVCDTYEYPTAYTRVSEYLNWIQENIRT